MCIYAKLIHCQFITINKKNYIKLLIYYNPYMVIIVSLNEHVCMYLHDVCMYLHDVCMYLHDVCRL